MATQQIVLDKTDILHLMQVGDGIRELREEFKDSKDYTLLAKLEHISNSLNFAIEEIY